MTRYRLSRVLRSLGDTEAAEHYAKEAAKTKEELVDKYPKYLRFTYSDDQEVFDQMISILAGRMSARPKIC
jgi:hypothetical protein